MKEYLINNNGQYELHQGGIVPDGAIEVPEGAEAYGRIGAINTFYKDGFLKFTNENNSFEWEDSSQWAMRREREILWSRFTQPEELPFVDDESKSLNDQYAEIEKVRQTLNERATQYGSFEDVAMTTQKIMDAIAWARGSDKLPAPHQEALHMIASKIARIVNGDCNHKDSWHDIQGYAKLIEELIG